MMSKNTFTLGVLPTTFLCNTSFHNLFYHSQYFPKGKYKASLFFPAQIGSISRLVLSKLIVSILQKFSNETGLKTKSLSWKKKGWKKGWEKGWKKGHFQIPENLLPAPAKGPLPQASLQHADSRKNNSAGFSEQHPCVHSDARKGKS